MAEESKTTEHDAKQASEVIEYELKTPPYRKPSPVGSYLVLIIALAIVGVIVYYILVHKQQFAQLWLRATHPDSVPAQVEPGP